MDIPEARKKTKEKEAQKEKARVEEKTPEKKTVHGNRDGEARTAMPSGNNEAVAVADAPDAEKSEIRNPKSEIQNEPSIRVLVFKLADHEHAVDVRQVKEILGAPTISPVVEAPDFVDGVIKLRGRIVPIVDLRKRLHLPVVQKSYQTCTIIVRLKKKYVGFVVDSASELLTVPTRLIEAASEIVGGIRTRFMEGVVYLEDRFLVILNLNKILTMNEKEMLDLGSEVEVHSKHDSCNSGKGNGQQTQNNARI